MKQLNIISGILMIFVLFILIIASAGVIERDRISKDYQDVNEALGNIQVALQRAYELLPNIEALFKLYLFANADLSGKVQTALRDVNQDRNVNITEVPAAQAVMQMQTMMLHLQTVNTLLTQVGVGMTANKDAFLSVQAEFEGTYNRAFHMRLEYNAAVKRFNSRISTWFGSATNSWSLQYALYPMFTADSGAQTVHRVTIL